METLFKLKLLNGRLAGREVRLPPGDTRLGGDDPDLALALENGTATVLSVTPEGVAMSPAVPVWVDGQPWAHDGPLPLGQVIDLAGQAFVLGALESELATVPVPARHVPRAPGTSRRQSQSQARSYGIAGGLVIATALALALALWQPPRAPEPFNVSEWVAQQLSDTDLAHVSFEKRGGNVIVLRGSCASSQKISKLRARLRERGILYRDETLCTDTLLQKVRKLIEFNGYKDFDVVSGAGPGTVKIRGNILADEKWQETAEQLRALHGLQGWKVVNDSAHLFDKLLAMLESRQLLEGVSIAMTGQQLLVTGQLPSRKMQAMQAAIGIFNHDRPRLQASFHNIPSSLPDGNLFPAAIVSLGGNARSLYIELANGMRLQAGSTLPSGYAIHSLSATSIALLKNQQLISLPLNL